MTFKPFADSTASSQIDNLTFENQGERLSIFGDIQITKDKAGLVLALQLQQRLNAIVEALQTQNLPEKIAAAEAGEEIDNPFK